MEHQSRVRNARRRCRKSILPPCWGSRSTPENDQIWERYNQQRTRCSRLLSKLPSNCRLLPWLLLLLTSYVVNSCNSKVIKCSSLSVVPRYNRLFYNILLPWELNYHLLYYSKSEVQHSYACLCTHIWARKGFVQKLIESREPEIVLVPTGQCTPSPTSAIRNVLRHLHVCRIF